MPLLSIFTDSIYMSHTQSKIYIQLCFYFDRLYQYIKIDRKSPRSVLTGQIINHIHMEIRTKISQLIEHQMRRKIGIKYKEISNFILRLLRSQCLKLVGVSALSWCILVLSGVVCYNVLRAYWFVYQERKNCILLCRVRIGVKVP